MGLGMAPMIPLARAEQPPRPFRGGPPGAAPPASDAPPASYPPLAELRARSTEEVAKTLRGSGMIIDGWIVPEDLSITFAQGKQNPVDVIVGSNKDEHLAMGGKVAFRDTLMWSMRLFAERQTAIGQHAIGTSSRTNRRSNQGPVILKRHMPLKSRTCSTISAHPARSRTPVRPGWPQRQRRTAPLLKHLVVLDEFREDR